MTRITEIKNTLFRWIDSILSGGNIAFPANSKDSPALVEQAVADPAGFLRALDGMEREALADLYRTLDSRVQTWGTCLSEDHAQSLNILIRSRDEAGLRLLAAGQREAVPSKGSRSA